MIEYKSADPMFHHLPLASLPGYKDHLTQAHGFHHYIREVVYDARNDNYMGICKIGIPFDRFYFAVQLQQSLLQIGGISSSDQLSHCLSLRMINDIRST